MPLMLSSEMDLAARLIRGASRLVVLSGAGLSKASGIPTYRDAGGLWTDPQNVPFSHVDAWRERPREFQRFWEKRQAELSKAQPNPAHEVLARFQQIKPETTLITQNVDGLLTRAGAVDVLELHGALSRMKCGGCGHGKGPWLLRRCPRCFARIRPDVVLFGENLDSVLYQKAFQAASRCDVFVSVGTSALVHPAADLPITALRWGAKLIVVDIARPLLANAADCYVEGPAEVVLPLLLDSSA